MSSFKTPGQTQSIECQYLQTYEGHKDGVWEVSTSRHVSTVLGTASAGMEINSLFTNLFVYK